MIASVVAGGLLSQGLATGGFIQGSAPSTLVSYVLAQSATNIRGNTIGDIDPTQATVLPNDASIGGIDPAQAGVVH